MLQYLLPSQGGSTAESAQDSSQDLPSPPSLPPLSSLSLSPTPDSYLSADSSGGIAEGEDGYVLCPAQPVHSNLGASGPLHHGDVVLPGWADQG